MSLDTFERFWVPLVRLAAWAGVYVRVIQIVAGVAAALIAGIIAALDRELQMRARWTTYFAASYAALALQYSLSPLAVWVGSRYGTPAMFSPTLSMIQATCATANSLLFLACARTLLEKRPVLPAIAWIAGVTAFVASLGTEPWFRLPDSLLAMYCLGLLAYAMYRNFSPARWHGLAGLNLLWGVAYALVLLTYILNPFIASLSSPFRDRLTAELARLATIRTMPTLPAGAALDAMAFGVAFLLKLALFLSALLLIMRSLVEPLPRKGRLAFRESARVRRTPYVAPELIARAVGESAGADRAVVASRVPGLRANRVMWWNWHKDSEESPIENPSVIDMAAGSSVVRSVLAHGQVELSENLAGDSSALGQYQRHAPGSAAFATLPVHYQGGIIGCLTVEWREPRPIDATTLVRLEQAAANLGPVLDARRQLHALHSFGERVHQLARESSSTSTVTNIRSLLRDLHDLLAPLATAVALDLGFRRYSVAESDLYDLSDLPDNLGHEAFGDQLTSTFENESADYELLSEPLTVGQSKLGQLIIFVALDRDPGERPSLGSDHPHRRAMASILSGALIELARRDLGEVLTRAQARLAKVRTPDSASWFRVSRFVARCTELPWVAASTVDAAGLVRYGFGGLRDAVREQLLALESEHGEGPVITVLHAAQGAAFLRLRLPASKAILWFGVQRFEFGTELTWSSPWNDFLSRLAESADAALVRFERQRLLLETSRRELLAAKSETSRLVLHEVRNRALEFSNGMLGVRTALEKGDSATALERAKGLEEQAVRFAQLASATHGSASPGSKPSTNLRQAVDMVQSLEDSRLQPRNIALTAMVPDLIVAVPIELVVLPLRELIENAARAIGRNGKIAITASDRGSHVECHVIDSGPGINRDIQDRLFELGVTTKDGGGGLGLALARNALITVGGFLALTRVEPTTLTLRLPKADKEIRS